MDRELIAEQEWEQKLGWKASLDYDDEDKPRQQDRLEQKPQERHIILVKDINGDVFGRTAVNGKFVPVKNGAHFKCMHVLDQEFLMFDSKFTDSSFREEFYAHLDKNCIKCQKPL